VASAEVASGNKLKGLVSSDVEPTLADINAAKAAQSAAASGVMPASAPNTLPSPVANARP
ncbi:MAG: hypothetical protein ABL893_21055, partial [Hyphomicrobium sp.]